MEGDVGDVKGEKDAVENIAMGDILGTNDIDNVIAARIHYDL